MNEQEQEIPPFEDQPAEAEAQAPEDQTVSEETVSTSDETPPEAAQPSKISKALNFAVGFLGWFLVFGLFYVPVSGEEMIMICGGLLFPANVLMLILLLKYQRFMGWGMLAALGLNLLISLIQGLSTNAFCFIPFFASLLQ